MAIVTRREGELALVVAAWLEREGGKIVIPAAELRIADAPDILIEIDNATGMATITGGWPKTGGKSE